MWKEMSRVCHKIEGCDCLPKTHQLAKTFSTCISCELCPMPPSVKKDDGIHNDTI